VAFPGFFERAYDYQPRFNDTRAVEKSNFRVQVGWEAPSLNMSFEIGSGNSLVICYACATVAFATNVGPIPYSKFT
jgi:hypothetical protein